MLLVLNRAAGTHQARAHVPGGLGGRRQVSVPLYPKVVTAAPKATSYKLQVKKAHFRSQRDSIALHRVVAQSMCKQNERLYPDSGSKSCLSYGSWRINQQTQSGLGRTMDNGTPCAARPQPSCWHTSAANTVSTQFLRMFELY